MKKWLVTLIKKILKISMACAVCGLPCFLLSGASALRAFRSFWESSWFLPRFMEPLEVFLGFGVGSLILCLGGLLAVGIHAFFHQGSHKALLGFSAIWGCVLGIIVSIHMFFVTDLPYYRFLTIMVMIGITGLSFLVSYATRRLTSPRK